MRNVLADLAVESEAATTAMLRLAGAHDRAVRGDEGEAALRRLGAGGHEVLRLQARTGPRRRGARVPGRQRLHRGLRPAADLPRAAAALDLGGLGQRRRARRPAADGPRAAHPGRVLRRGRARLRSRRPLRRRAWRRCKKEHDFLRRHRGSRPPGRGAARAGVPGFAACSATHRPRSRTRSAPPGWPATGAARSARCPPASTSSRFWSARGSPESAQVFLPTNGVGLRGVRSQPLHV